MTWNQIAKWGAGVFIVIAALALTNTLGLDWQTVLDALTFATENSQ